VIALYAGTVFEDGDQYRRFALRELMLVGTILGLVLTDHAEILSFFLMFTFLLSLVLISFDAQREVGGTQWPRWKQSLSQLAYLLTIGIVRVGLTVLGEFGAVAKQLDRGMVEVSLLGSSNLSKTMSYELFFILILAPLVGHTLFNVWFWRFVKQMFGAVHAFASTSVILGSTYILVRFYASVHDNPLWWNVVTGVGLLVMLIGTLWALRQRESKAILVYRLMSAFGACVALLGLPEFLGYKVALIGIVSHALSGAALFLSTDINRAKRSRLIIVGLALLPMAIFHVLMIGAFAQVTLSWAGIALAVVALSTALWVVNAIRIIRHDRVPYETAGEARLIGEIMAGILALASLVCVALFDAIFAPLLNPMMMPEGVASDLTTALMLGVLALIGGVILYATREIWGRYIQSPQPQPQPLPFS
jgi:hypothetical protein